MHDWESEAQGLVDEMAHRKNALKNETKWVVDRCWELLARGAEPLLMLVPAGLAAENRDTPWGEFSRRQPGRVHRYDDGTHRDRA